MARFFWIPFRAAALVLGGAMGDVKRHRPQDRSSPSQLPLTRRSRVAEICSSYSGRIAFDNFEDVWTIDADGTRPDPCG